MSFAKAYATIIKDIDDKVFRELAERFRAGDHRINVGFIADGKKVKGGEMLVSQQAAIHEFGAPQAGIPERSFLRSSIEGSRDKYIQLNRESLLKILRKKTTVRAALGLLGETAKADVQQFMAEGMFEPLKPATIARKGSSQPLIDSGQMRQSVRWQFDEKKS